MSQPTVCLVYVFEATEQPLLELSLEVMLKYPWVSTAVGLETTGTRIDIPGIAVTSLDFGRGIATHPDKGGFRQVHARNRSLEIGEASGCDWLLLCDADEFFTPDAWHPLCNANNLGRSTCWYDCYHFCGPDTYLWDPAELHRISPHSTVMLTDPHPRAIRSSARHRYVFNGNLAKDQGDNPHRHCLIGCDVNEAYTAVGICHVHVRHWLKGTASSKPRKKVAQAIMPAPYLVYAAKNNLLNV